MFPSVEVLVKLLLVRPSSSCESERSFSALRRLKTWLRTTMTAERLNSLCICHVHKDTLSEVDDDELIHDCVSRNEWRQKLFNV